MWWSWDIFQLYKCVIIIALIYTNFYNFDNIYISNYKGRIKHINTLLGRDLALVLTLKNIYKMLWLWLFLQVVSFYQFCGYWFFWHLGLTC